MVKRTTKFELKWTPAPEILLNKEGTIGAIRGWNKYVEYDASPNNVEILENTPVKYLSQLIIIKKNVKQIYMLLNLIVL